jgi:hypothetical protein
MRTSLLIASLILAGCDDTPPGDADLAQASTDLAAPLADALAPDQSMPLGTLDPTPGIYQGSCDGSGGVALDADHFLDVNDEDQQVRVYKRGATATAVHTVDVSVGIGLKVGDEADFEDVARIGNRLYVVSSHGRDKNGDLEPARHRFFALDVGGTLPSLSVTVAGYGSSLVADLLDASRWTTPSSVVIALLQSAAQPATASDPALAPEVDGLNIEGLAAWPSASQPNRLVLGLRNPRSGADAILVTLLNADAMLGGARAQLGEAVTLDLGGLGVRSMTWSPAHQALLILAGERATGSTFKIYKWSGASGAKPTAMATLTPPADHSAEALITYPNTLDVQVLFDQGDLMIDGNTCKKAMVAKKYFTDQIVHID